MVRLPLQCVLWGCIWTSVYPEPPTECGENQYLLNSQCCDKCRPGEKLVNDCTQLTVTQCLPCSKGEFSDTWNRDRRCHEHRYCDPNLGLRVEREGSAERDTLCACEEGRHCTGGTCESCALHTSCGPGLGVKQLGTGTSDTVCEPCPVGFFSNVSSAFEKCHPWTSCETKDLVERQPGTNVTDAICGFQSRTRALVVIPIVGVLLLAIFLVSLYIRESPGGWRGRGRRRCRVPGGWIRPPGSHPSLSSRESAQEADGEGHPSSEGSGARSCGDYFSG
uniref:Tumor necrosis factor receptor superfamily member 5 n=1 Tax=Urocitellus parryii TaxID=9999 RepID=A0A8D2GPE1_UROPR